MGGRDGRFNGANLRDRDDNRFRSARANLGSSATAASTVGSTDRTKALGWFHVEVLDLEQKKVRVTVPRRRAEFLSARERVIADGESPMTTGLPKESFTNLFER